MKYILFIVFSFNSLKNLNAQDSLYAAEIDSTVLTIQNRITKFKSPIWRVNVFFKDWHEQYYIDTFSKKLLQVKFFRVTHDTLPRHHAITHPFYDTFIHYQIIYFYYLDDKLVKIFDSLSAESYYPKDSGFVLKTQSGWKTSYDDLVLNTYSFFSNRFIRHYKDLFIKNKFFTLH